MNDLLIKLKLIDHLKITLPINKEDFINRLLSITEIGDTGFFFNQWEIFSSSNYEYKGTVDYDGFELRKKQKIFSYNSFATFKGEFSEKEEQLEIDIEIDGFNMFYLFFYCFVLIIYTFIIISFLAGDQPASWFTILLFMLHSSLMLIVPYITIRIQVKKIKYELERDFFYLTK